MTGANAVPNTTGTTAKKSFGNSAEGLVRQPNVKLPSTIKIFDDGSYKLTGDTELNHAQRNLLADELAGKADRYPLPEACQDLNYWNPIQVAKCGAKMWSYNQRMDAIRADIAELRQ